jgi:hypothetical protein
LGLSIWWRDEPSCCTAPCLPSSTADTTHLPFLSLPVFGRSLSPSDVVRALAILFYARVRGCFILVLLVLLVLLFLLFLLWFVMVCVRTTQTQKGVFLLTGVCAPDRRLPSAAWHRLGCLLRGTNRPRLSLGLCTPACTCQVLVCSLELEHPGHLPLTGTHSASRTHLLARR